MTVEPDDLIGGDGRVPVALLERHCGRCQRAFPGDPTLFFQTDWALCPACQAILLPKRPATPPSGARSGSTHSTADLVTPWP
jgi:hypothetical protein